MEMAECKRGLPRVNKDIAIEECRETKHCHSLSVTANGREWRIWIDRHALSTV